jgi:uncharacterized protein (TIGR02757 family)
MVLKGKLEQLYGLYNRREFVHPDPLEFLYDYRDLCDREIVAFVASSLAYGRVAQILKSVSRVLERMTPSPRGFLKRASQKTVAKTFSDFRHRFTGGRELCAMLLGLKHILRIHGSLNACFIAGWHHGDDTVLEALTAFTKALAEASPEPLGHLVPSPEKGSACKRLHLFLRWMVRQDHVDPGGWQHVSPSKLIVPVDIHMHRICLCLGLTTRKQANQGTALEITESFRAMVPEDPVKYDFALTRLGIRNDCDLNAFLDRK